jgi:SOS-response transcriptional repressor LexA
MNARAKKEKETFGTRIKAKRIELDLTQEQLAQEIGVRRETVTQWEKDQTKVTGENLLKLADTLKVSGTWLIKGGTAGANPVRYVPEFGARGASVVRPTTSSVGPRAFWWRVPEGDTSMVCPDGDISFPPGSVLIVDPDAEVVSGDFVLTGPTNPTCRQFHIIGKQQRIFALNSKVKALPLSDSHRVLGVIVQLQRDIKR